MAVAIRKRLQARAAAQTVKDIGIDGEYTSANAIDPFNFTMVELEGYVLSREDLAKHQYPLDGIAASEGDESSKRMCERCDNEFDLDDDDENFMTACTYHPGYLESKKMTGTLF